jgi:hypothetical protein
MSTVPYEKCYKLRVKQPDGTIVFELSSKIASSNGTVLGYKDAFRHKVTGKEVKDLFRYRNSRDP